MNNFDKNFEKNKENKDNNSPENENRDSENVLEKAKDKRKNYYLVTFLLSFLAAFIMWIVAVDYDVEDYEKTFNNINVQLTGQSELLSATGMQVKLDGDIRLSITANGKRSFLSKLDASSFQAKVDVSGLTSEGKSDPLKITIEHVNGITVTSQSMAYVTVTAEKRVSDSFEIVPLLGTAQLENGVEYSLSCGAETVTVTGSESIIKNIKRAVVYVNPEPKNITESFKSQCEILFESDVDVDFSSLVVSPQYCSVDVILTKEKSVPAEIKLEGGADLEYGPSFHPSVKTFLIVGEPKDVDKIESIYINIPYEKIKNQLGSGKTSFTVKGIPEFPSGIEEVNGIKEVEVTVDVSSGAKNVFGEDVHIINCPLGYTVNVSEIEIKLTGLYEELEAIDSSQISVSLDLTGVVPTVNEQKVRGTVLIDNSYSVVYESKCLLSISFMKSSIGQTE